MSLIIDSGEEREEVKLTTADIKKYAERFSQLVVQFSKLQFNGCVGKGKYHSSCCSNLFTNTSLLQCNNSILY